MNNTIKIPWWHYLGFHDWHKIEEKGIEPKCGPYDPRLPGEREYSQEICCICGEKRRWTSAGAMYW